MALMFGFMKQRQRGYTRGAGGVVVAGSPARHLRAGPSPVESVVRRLGENEHLF